MSVSPCVGTIGDAADEVIDVTESLAHGGVEVIDVAESQGPVEAHDVVESASSVATTELDVGSDAEPDVEAVHDDTTVATTGARDNRFESMHRVWWEGASGVVDARPWGPGTAATSGKVLRYCSYTIGRLIGTSGGRGTVTYKVGIAHDVCTRWSNYVTHDPIPFSHMFVLHQTSTKEGAEFLEAGLIAMNWDTPHFVNKKRSDMGGTGNSGGCFVYVIAHRGESLELARHPALA